MKVHVCGTPSFSNLQKWEKEALMNPLLEVIKEFYTKEENRKAYLNWKSNKEHVTEQKLQKAI